MCRMVTDVRHHLRHREEGLTLVELLLVILVLPVLVGGIALLAGGVLNADRSVSTSVSVSASIQTTMQPFFSDVQASTGITTDSALGCGPLAGVLSIETSKAVVTYALAPDGNTYTLLRYYCAGSATANATSVIAVAHNVTAQGVSVTVTPTTPSGSWTSSTQIYSVTLNVSTTNGTFNAEANPNAALLN